MSDPKGQDLNYFEELGLSERLAKILADNGLTDPTPIQSKAIPLALEGRDVMGLAQTGSGKTAAFGLPMIQLMSSIGTKPAPKTVRGLILAPTRELAKQISLSLEDYTRGTHLRVGLVVGGASIGPQIKRLERGTDILVATPGRLLDLLDRRAVLLTETGFLVLDEADQMLDLGFIHALRRIAKLLPADRQTLLFSATMPKQMAELAESYLNNAARVQVNAPGKPVEKIAQSLHYVAKSEKTGLLIELLDKHRDQLAIVFARTKHGSEKLKRSLESAGFAATSVHGNKSQGQRERAIAEFKAGEKRVLVATDVAARGLDIPDVRYVYNYELPNVAENYVHRIGRTARAGADGSAVAFCGQDEMGELDQIQKAMKITIPVAGGRPWQGAEIEKKPARGGGNRRRGGGGGGNGGGQGPQGGKGKPQQAARANAKPGQQRRRRRAA
ncbi:DEAD/DEAH box helicase [Brevirhabdus sp.]|uniref:DEAD/DEAH box helicase n=1 Tax=Brevirhabdus sp. TaxID=2004514 RepID=UPI0040597123